MNRSVSLGALVAPVGDQDDERKALDMAKRGEIRPWRVRYVWENGVKGCETRRTEDDAARFADEVRRSAEQRGMTVEISITERGA